MQTTFHRLSNTYSLKPRFFALFAAAMLFMPSMLLAEITWESNLIDMGAAPTQKSVNVTFRGTNTGADPITILKVEKSCGCTEATPSTMLIEPGESLDIPVSVALKPYGGTQTIRVTLLIKDGDPIPLTIKINVPPIVEISPRALFWNERKPLTSTISLMLPGVKLISLVASDPAIATSIEEKDNGTKIIITVTPGNNALEKSLLTANFENTEARTKFPMSIPLNVRIPKTLLPPQSSVASPEKLQQELVNIKRSLTDALRSVDSLETLAKSSKPNTQAQNAGHIVPTSQPIKQQ